MSSDFSILRPDAEPFDSPVLRDSHWDDNHEEYGDESPNRYDDEYKAMCITYMLAHRAGMADGISYAQASRALHVGSQTLSKWLKSYKESGETVNDNVRDILDNQVVALDMKINSLLGTSIELLTERVSAGDVETDDLIKLVTAMAKTKQGLHDGRINAELKEKQISAEKEGAGSMRQLVSGLSALGDLKESIQRRIESFDEDVIEGAVIE